MQESINARELRSLCSDVGLPQEFLHSPDIIALLAQMQRKTMPKRVAADALAEPSQLGCPLHHLLHSTLTHMMAMQCTRAQIFRQPS